MTLVITLLLPDVLLASAGAANFRTFESAASSVYLVMI